MKQHIEHRVRNVVNHIILNKCTVRDTAIFFNVSKSTIHKDAAERILELNLDLAKEVREILDFNYKEKHLRGGKATQEKHRSKKLL